MSDNGEVATAQVVLDAIAVEKISVPLVGTAPLLMHRFSEKSKRQMLDDMQGRKTPKAAKDPQAEYEAAFYRFTDGRVGFPLLAFKAATVGAARFYSQSKLSMTALKQFLTFLGEPGEDGTPYVEITGEPTMREDRVRVGRGGTDLRYRPTFWPWSTFVTVRYPTAVLTRNSILSLIDAGGMGVGVGEWRPERDGAFGTYEIDTKIEIEIIG